MSTTTSDLSISEVSRQAGIARSTTYDHLEFLIDPGIVKETRETGSSSRYQLNGVSPIAERLCEPDGLILRQLLEIDEGVIERVTHQRAG